MSNTRKHNQLRLRGHTHILHGVLKVLNTGLLRDGSGLADGAAGGLNRLVLYHRAALVRVDLDGILQGTAAAAAVAVQVVVGLGLVLGLGLVDVVVPRAQVVVHALPAGGPGVFDGLVELFLHGLLVLAGESILKSSLSSPVSLGSWCFGCPSSRHVTDPGRRFTRRRIWKEGARRVHERGLSYSNIPKTNPLRPHPDNHLHLALAPLLMIARRSLTDIRAAAAGGGRRGCRRRRR